MKKRRKMLNKISDTSLKNASAIVIRFIKTILQLLFAIALAVPTISLAQSGQPTESDYYKIGDVPIPDDIMREIGGMDVLPDGSLAVCTLRGRLWIIKHPSSEPPKYQLFADGLHEPLG